MLNINSEHNKELLKNAMPLDKIAEVLEISLAKIKEISACPSTGSGTAE